MAGLQRVEYVTSQRGTQQVYFQGHLYNKNKTRQSCIHWRCTVKTCTGKCTTVGDFVRDSSEHNHPPPDETRLGFISSLRKRAREEPTRPMPALYQDELLKYNQDDVAALPSYTTVDSALYRHRSHTIPRLPTTLAEVHLDGIWTETLDSERFLLFVDGEDDKIIVFATDIQLKALQSAEVIYMDGTFTASPDLWNQLYIIHAKVGSVSYPLVYALLPSRTIATYRRLLSLLKTHVQRIMNRPLAPTKVQTDFEMAAIRAVQIEFPAAEVKGCFFHFAQAVWRKVQALGLVEDYRDDPEVEKWIRRASALPLLPIAHVQDVWINAMEMCPDIPAAVHFNDYMVTTWVDDDSLFALSMWNHHNNFGPRTNNCLEGFNSRLNASLSSRHPNVFRLIDIVKKIEKADRLKIVQLDFGAAPPSRKRVYREVNQRLGRLQEQLQNGTKTPMQYLDAVAKLVKLG